MVQRLNHGIVSVGLGVEGCWAELVQPLLWDGLKVSWSSRKLRVKDFLHLDSQTPPASGLPSTSFSVSFHGFFSLTDL